MKNYRAIRCNECGQTPSAHGIEFRRTKRFRIDSAGQLMVSHSFVYVYPNEK